MELAEVVCWVFVQLAKLAGVSEAGLDHFYKVLRVCGQWSLLDEAREGRLFSANSATRQLVRGKDATLGHFVDHQVRRPSASCSINNTISIVPRTISFGSTCHFASTIYVLGVPPTQTLAVVDLVDRIHSWLSKAASSTCTLLHVFFKG